MLLSELVMYETRLDHYYCHYDKLETYKLRVDFELPDGDVKTAIRNVTKWYQLEAFLEIWPNTETLRDLLSQIITPIPYEDPDDNLPSRLL